MTSAGEGSRSARSGTEDAVSRETARTVAKDGDATAARREDAAADPRGTLDGASIRPIFEGSGFWGLSRATEGIFRERRRTFLGRLLVWCLVALGFTCLAARTTRVAGAPITKAILLASSEDARCVLRSDCVAHCARKESPERAKDGGETLIGRVDFFRDCSAVVIDPRLEDSFTTQEVTV